MPIYEFYCPKNNKIYTFLARSLAYSGRTPRCPDHPEYPMERLISSFSVTGRAKEKSDAEAFPMDDAKMERAMSEMEREFSGMDEENPDPRQLAKMMRKMSDATGEQMPAGMQEMMRRMEAGEDPEKLEAEYGDAFGEFEAAQAEDGGQQGGKIPRRNRPPQRDPVLYEMADYVGETL
jgi:hypothetical protein